MDIDSILAKLDELLESNQTEKAERFLLESIGQAVEQEENECLLQLLNELIGFYRVSGRHEDSAKIGLQAIGLAKRMGLEGTVPYATTLLNVANAYRAAGNLEEALGLFQCVEKIYAEGVAKDNLLMAGLLNNMSLLYQEMGEYEAAFDSQKKALDIVQNKEAHYEIAVTYANLAATCVLLGHFSEALDYAGQSMQVFDSIGVKDSHYGAALAAIGTCYYNRQNYGEAAEYFRRAMELVEQGVGRNSDYERLAENLKACEYLHSENGLSISRKYYETYGEPMLCEKFSGYLDKIAVGLAGRGSDCFGYDDEASRDHDWGPEFCLWVSDETYEEIGKQLEEAYDALPKEFMGYKRAPRVNAKNRRGVIRISDFYKGLVGTDCYEEIDWTVVTDSSLAAAVNGEIYRDEEGSFSAFRKKLLSGYPEGIRYLKIAEAAAKFSQSAQYNTVRMAQRGDFFTAKMMLWEGLRQAILLQHYIDGHYPPHDKWLKKSLQQSDKGRKLLFLIENVTEKSDRHLAGTEWIDQMSKALDEIGSFFSRQLYGLDIISDIDPYLDAHSEELIYKASLTGKTGEELAETIARIEFEAFDKVRNEGGRASCQNDWQTFSIMRKSQYLTWTRVMQMQYLYDFKREFQKGHNLIEEKYGRMMESTAPGRYEEIKDHFPVLSEEKKAIIEQICRMQVDWMEEFAKQYPALAGNARSIHTSEDNPFNTSYETYLRGELGTYSDKMLELYGRYIVEYAKDGKNPAYDIMENSIRMYGYVSLEEAEKKTAVV